VNALSRSGRFLKVEAACHGVIGASYCACNVGLCMVSITFHLVLAMYAYSKSSMQNVQTHIV